MTEKNYMQASNIKDFKHGFFTKKGGVSSGIYTSLNCSMSSNDKKQNIIKNRIIISKLLDFDHESLLVANQFHSNKVKIINSPLKDIKCDGMICLSKKITLGVLTADCCPILVVHKRRFIAAVIHLGWQGLFNGILENFFHKIKLLGIKRGDLKFALGPCIGKESYEVKLHFKEKFKQKDKKSELFFNTVNDQIFFDLRGYAESILISLGCSNIWSSKSDTYKQNDIFFSYRYSYRNNLSDYGRMLSVIKI